MDNFSTPSSTTKSTSNLILGEQQNLGYVQFHDYSTSEPYGLPATPSYHAPLTQFHFQPPYKVLPYDDPNMMVQYPCTVVQPMCSSSYPTGQSCVMFDMKNSQSQSQGWSSQSQPVREEEDRRIKEAWSKKARDKRKQVRKRDKSSSGRGAPLISEGTIVSRGHDVTTSSSRRELNVKITMTVPQNKNCNVFCAPDGKRLKEILTKKLQNSDVSNLGRIVLPKRDVEEKLPALRDREGIDILFKDVYSDLWWSLKYRYWVNNKSRMYVLENTGEFVKHYGLQMGDFVTLYEDEHNTMYVSVKKVQNSEVLESLLDREMLYTQGTYNNSKMQIPYTVQGKDEEEDAYLDILIKELDHKREEATANSLWTLDGGCSFPGTEQGCQMGQHSSSNNINITGGHHTKYLSMQPLKPQHHLLMTRQ